MTNKLQRSNPLTKSDILELFDEGSKARKLGSLASDNPYSSEHEWHCFYFWYAGWKHQDEFLLMLKGGV